MKASPKPSARKHGQPFEFVVGESTADMALQIGERRQHEAVLHGRPPVKGRFKKNSADGGDPVDVISETSY